jgi:hypothetical protein
VRPKYDEEEERVGRFVEVTGSSKPKKEMRGRKVREAIAKSQEDVEADGRKAGNSGETTNEGERKQCGKESWIWCHGIYTFPAK